MSEQVGNLREALENVRNWFESERKSISKGNGSQWAMRQCEEQRDAIDEVLKQDQEHYEMPEPIEELVDRLPDDWNYLSKLMLNAGEKFWKAHQLEQSPSAVTWVQGDEGALFVFTRGEYRRVILEFLSTLPMHCVHLVAPSSPLKEPDWSDSKTLPSEMWKNPLIPMPERLQIADGAVRFRDDVIRNLRLRLFGHATVEAAQPTVEQITVWLESPEGKARIAESKSRCSQAVDQLNEDRKVSTAELNEPYASLEREHLGDPDKGTGIYHPENSPSRPPPKWCPISDAPHDGAWFWHLYPITVVGIGIEPYRKFEIRRMHRARYSADGPGYWMTDSQSVPDHAAMQGWFIPCDEVRGG